MKTTTNKPLSEADKLYDQLRARRQVGIRSNYRFQLTDDESKSEGIAYLIHSHRKEESNGYLKLCYKRKLRHSRLVSLY